MYKKIIGKKLLHLFVLHDLFVIENVNHKKLLGMFVHYTWCWRNDTYIMLLSASLLKEKMKHAARAC